MESSLSRGNIFNRAVESFIANSHYPCIDSIPINLTILLKRGHAFFIDYCSRTFEGIGGTKEFRDSAVT